MIAALRKFAKGDPADEVLKADFINGLVDASRRANAMGLGSQTTTSGGTPPTTFVRINNTSTALTFGQIVKQTGLATAFTNEDERFKFRRSPCFTVGTPAATTDVPLIVTGSIPQGSMGAVAIAGIAVTRIDVSDAGHLFAQCGTVKTHLDSSDSGPARILYKAAPDDGDIGWAVVLLGPNSGGSSNLPVPVSAGPDPTNSFGGTGLLIPVGAGHSVYGTLTITLQVFGIPSSFNYASVLVFSHWNDGPVTPLQYATTDFRHDGATMNRMNGCVTIHFSFSNLTGSTRYGTFKAQPSSSPGVGAGVVGYAGMAYLS